MRTPIAEFRGHVLTAVAGIAVAVGFLLALLYLGHGLPSTKESYEVTAVLPTSAALAPGARVTMAGARVGVVREVSRRGAGALIELRIDDDRVTPLPKDSTVRLRARTPVGENYVSVVPGRSRETLSSGGALPIRNGDEYVDVDQILTVLQGESRDHARKLLQGLGKGLDGRAEQLHTLVDQTSRAMTDGAEVVRIVDDNRTKVSSLVEQLGDLSREVGDRGDAIRRLSRSGLVTFRALADRDEAVRALLETLPPTLDQVRSTSGRLGAVTATAAPVLQNLAVALREVRPAVRHLEPAARTGRRVVDELGAAAPGLRTTLTKLEPLAKPSKTALPALRDALCQVDPVIRYAKPYTKDIISAVGALGSSANAYDALGHTIRLNAIVSDNSLVGLPKEVSAAAHTLLHAGFLSKVNGLTWDPYPEPGQIGKATAEGKAVLGPEALAKTGWKYPRIMPDC